ncbi:hypothetical protein RIR_jg18634.t1 [Rhizophagus irregularis DAOM 181602=DAOM 197198]|uniref:Uncharacterized protein n=1 Tax=Rhizophagus irregularis (strain DAOM 181602 / DAOM 197198 / MUCL 43194) TaxID=747089 RepID=U9U928_RHIID|nr:hypothetical protein RIR_jg18634.t1 [Rhizophagus irregularis DAOM 181602=DAOM 197198]
MYLKFNVIIIIVRVKNFYSLNKYTIKQTLFTKPQEIKDGELLTTFNSSNIHVLLLLAWTFSLIDEKLKNSTLCFPCRYCHLYFVVGPHYVSRFQISNRFVLRNRVVTPYIKSLASVFKRKS